MLLNVTEIGSPKVYNGVVSGFSAANYLKITDSFDVSAAQSWEVVYKIKTGTNITTGQSMCGHTGSSNYDPFTIDINSSKFQLGLCKSSSSNLLKDKKGTYTVLVDTTYWLKLTFNGSRYALSYSLDGVDFIEDIVFESTTKIWTSNLVLGRQQGDSSEFPFLGTIDLNECYIKINGELWWTGMVEGGIKPVRSYVFKRRETKYYKEVVTEGESYACFTLADENFYYLKKPYGVGDYFHYTADGGLATTISELVQSTLTVYKVNSDGSVSFYMSLLPGGDPVEIPLPPYPSGDLTTTTTELVPSTKDDYDVVKTEESFYSLRRKGGVKYYKEVVTKRVDYACYDETIPGYGTSYGYAKLPLNSDMTDYMNKNNAGSIATSPENLVDGKVKWKELTEEYAVNYAGRTCPRYREGDLTTTTTELVESTKDDYDVIKEFEGSSHSLCRRKNNG